jgi:hypothetical protein
MKRKNERTEIETKRQKRIDDKKAESKRKRKMHD